MWQYEDVAILMSMRVLGETWYFAQRVTEPSGYWFSEREFKRFIGVSQDTEIVLEERN